MTTAPRIDGWTVIGSIAALSLISVLILQPQVNSDNILTALRVSSATTAIPFLLLFALTPFDRAGTAAHRWLTGHRAEAWLILTASHLVHLGQIGLYYRLGQTCPLTVWLITIPVWLVMLAVTLVVLTRQQLLAGGGSGGSRWAGALYAAGLWVVWLVFLLAFALGSAAGHLLAYNLPALVLFLAAALGWLLPPLRRVVAAGR
ncbi:MAG: hypothetical protein VKI83_08310 [Synechococcaceae cyanobacterium]|nr:hypothetical protein [Synechococcaceae cyanobacterium]